MALTNKQLEQLNWLEYDEAYILDDSKSELTQIPTLIIGIGGTGVDALLKIKHKLKTSFREAENIQFLAIDTDMAASGKQTGQSVLTKLTDDEFLLLGKNLNLSQQLKLPEDRWTPEQQEFMPRGVNYNPGINAGAGGWRVVGRFLLFNKILDITTRLEKIISNIRQTKRGRNSLSDIQMNVMVVTGIAGGTGSGASIDIAYIIRCILEQKFQLDKYNLTGYIVLPDVNQSNRDNQYSESNGYAYLKELDYLQSLSANHETFEQSYKSYKYKGDKGPFDECYLISGKDTHGSPVSSGSIYEKVQNTIADSIADTLTDATNYTSSNSDDKSFIESFKSNIGSIKGNTNLGRSDVENDSYYSFGSASIALPMPQMVRYLSALIFEKLGAVEANKPNQTDYDRFYHDINIKSNFLQIYMQDLVTYGSEFPHTNWKDYLKSNYSYKKIIKNDGGKKRLEIELNKSMIQIVKMTLNNNRINILSHLKNTARDTLQEYLNDSDKGPWYVNRLFGRSDPIHDITPLFAYIDNFQKVLDSAIKLQDSRINEFERVIESLESEKPGFGVFKRTDETIIQEYIQSHLDMYEQKIEKLYLEELKSLYSSYRTALKELAEKYYSPLVEVLDKWMTISRHTIKTLEQTGKTIAGNDSTIESFVDISLLCKSLRHNYYTINVSNKDFLDHIRDNSDKILGGDRGDALDLVGLIHDFIQTKYSNNLLNFSLYEAILWGAGVEQKQSFDTDMISNPQNASDIKVDDYILKTIKKTLNINSRTSIYLTSPDNSTTMPDNIRTLASYERLAVPENSQSDQLYAILDKAKQLNDTVDRVKDNLKISEINFICGFPLYMYSYLTLYQNTYESEIVGEDRLRAKSLHLFGFEDKDWVDLPNIIPNSINLNYPSSREGQRLDEVAEIFKQAEKYGIITQDGNSIYKLHLQDRHNAIELGVGAKALMRLQKMYQNITEIKYLIADAEENANREEAIAQKKEQAKEAALLFLTDIITQESPNSYKYQIVFGDNVVSLGNHITNRHYLEYYVYQSYMESEKLSDTQRTKALVMAKNSLDKLQDDAQLYLDKVALFSSEIQERLNAIINNNPDNATELTEFYNELQSYVNNHL